MSLPASRRTVLRLIILVVAVAVGLWYYGAQPERSGPATAESRATVERAFADRVSGIMLDADGRVQRELADDDEGSRHQRFILELPSGHTVLVAHNIDLAPRVPLARGDRVALHGQYEWNERGGVLHWTHRDPDGRHPGGWIDHAGQRYQ